MSNILEQSEYAVKTRNQTIILEHLKYYYFTTKKGRQGLFSCSFFMFLHEVLFPFLLMLFCFYAFCYIFIIFLGRISRE